MLTAKVQYAIVLLHELTRESDKKAVRLKDVAAKHEINIDLLEQVARLLRIAGFIASVRGPGGGYKLNCEVSSLNPVMIMKAVDPDKGLKLAVHSQEGSQIIQFVYERLMKSLELKR